LRPDFRIGFVGVAGHAGAILMDPALIIYTSSSVMADDSPRYVASERVAGVIYAVRTLNDKSLAEGYKLIGQVKALPGQDTDSVAGWHHIPIGMIVACECERPLEELADSIAILNTQFPSTRWADAVSVLSRGLINHAVQFERSQDRRRLHLAQQNGGDAVRYVCPRNGCLTRVLHLQSNVRASVYASRMLLQEDGAPDQ